MQNRHTYILDVIAIHLGDGEERDYLFLTASIYASIISTSPVARSSEDGRHFLDIVKRYHGGSKDDPNRQQLCGALRVDEVAWAAVDRALGPADAGSASNSNSANNAMTGCHHGVHPHDQDPALGNVVESGGRFEDEVNSSGSGRNFEGEHHEEELAEVVIHSPSP